MNAVSVANGGTIVVGTSDADTSIGTFTLGSLALSGVLEMGATGALTYDKLITTGAFSVTGGTITSFTKQTGSRYAVVVTPPALTTGLVMLQVQPAVFASAAGVFNTQHYAVAVFYSTP